MASVEVPPIANNSNGNNNNNSSRVVSQIRQILNFNWQRDDEYAVELCEVCSRIAFNISQSVDGCQEILKESLENTIMEIITKKKQHRAHINLLNCLLNLTVRLQQARKELFITNAQLKLVALLRQSEVCYLAPSLVNVGGGAGNGG